MTVKDIEMRFGQPLPSGWASYQLLLLSVPRRWQGFRTDFILTEPSSLGKAFSEGWMLILLFAVQGLQLHLVHLEKDVATGFNGYEGQCATFSLMSVMSFNLWSLFLYYP